MHNFETLTVYKMNNRALNINLEGLNHEDSLVSSEHGGNCINWIIGHIIISRDDFSEILGIDKISNENLLAKYSRGTKPITKETATDFNELLDIFNKSQAAIEEKIAFTDFANRQEDLKSLASHAFHEAYHVGQTGLLRRIAGKSGAIK